MFSYRTAGGKQRTPSKTRPGCMCAYRGGSPVTSNTASSSVVPSQARPLDSSNTRRRSRQTPCSGCRTVHADRPHLETRPMLQLMPPLPPHPPPPRCSTKPVELGRRRTTARRRTIGTLLDTWQHHKTRATNRGRTRADLQHSKQRF